MDASVATDDRPAVLLEAMETIGQARPPAPPAPPAHASEPTRIGAPVTRRAAEPAVGRAAPQTTARPRAPARAHPRTHGRLRVHAPTREHAHARVARPSEASARAGCPTRRRSARSLSDTDF